MRRLVGHARVIGAIGQGGDSLAAAEEEVGLPGIPNRPAAGFLRELEQAPALAERDHVIDELWLRFDVELIGVGERGIAADRMPRDPQHVRMGARLARARGGRRRRLGTGGEPEAVHLADHRIAGHTAKCRGDLTRRQPLGPQPLQRFDPFVGPSHVKFLPSRDGGDRIPLRVWATISWPDAYPRYRLTLVTVRRTKCRIRRWKSYNMAGVGRKSPVDLRPHVLSASVNASTLICTPVYCG